MFSYPIVRDGLIYVADSVGGLYVLRYTGPRADWLAGVGRAEGNVTVLPWPSPTRSFWPWPETAQPTWLATSPQFWAAAGNRPAHLVGDQPAVLGRSRKPPSPP